MFALALASPSLLGGEGGGGESEEGGNGGNGPVLVFENSILLIRVQGYR